VSDETSIGAEAELFDSIPGARGRDMQNLLRAWAGKTIPPDELDDALDALEDAELPGKLSDQQARQFLGLPARNSSEKLIPHDEARRRLGLGED
jgi:hypothetical protein